MPSRIQRYQDWYSVRFTGVKRSKNLVPRSKVEQESENSAFEICSVPGTRLRFDRLFEVVSPRFVTFFRSHQERMTL